MKISSVVITFNEEDKIEACLESLAWTDEIIVVDSGSTDRTPEISRRHTDRFFRHPWQGMIEQKKYATSLASNDWILSLDADERVSPELRAEIEAFRAGPPPSFDGFEIPRKNFYIDRWVRHAGWYPDRKLRFFRRSKAVWKGLDPHDRVEILGPVGRLRGEILHHSFDSIEDHADRVNQYSSISAGEYALRGRKARWYSLLVHPGFRFIKAYVLRGGFLDGRVGFIVSMMQSYEVFVKYAKLWELGRQRSDGGGKKRGG